MPDNTLLKNRLKRMTAWDSEPQLSDGDLDDLLSLYSTFDKNGVVPGDLSWIPTYRLNAAAAEGWRWKSARASELISVDLDGERMSSNQVFEHCQRMIQTYSRRLSGSVSTTAK